MSHRIHLVVLAAALLACGNADAQSRWTANGQLGVAIGSQSAGSLAWRAGIHRWLRDSQALGLEAGMFYWDGSAHDRDERGDFIAYQNLKTDPNMLTYVSSSFRVRGLREDGRSAPYFALGIGAYRQSIDVDWAAGDPRDGVVRPGGSITFGGGGIRGLKPCMDFRYDWIDTNPGPSHYFTASMGLQLDR